MRVLVASLFLELCDKITYRIDHLLQKLKSSGVVDRMHDWLKNYLHQRFQRVLVDGAVSD
jgi:hypothetical protein